MVNGEKLECLEPDEIRAKLEELLEELEHLAPDEIQARLEEILKAVQAKIDESPSEELQREVIEAYLKLGVFITKLALDAALGFENSELRWAKGEIEELSNRIRSQFVADDGIVG